MSDDEILKQLRETTPEEWAEFEAMLKNLEETDPKVKAAKERWDRTVERIVGTGPALSFEEIRKIYGDQ